ncbi:MAG: HAMP domain-containing sensor histidine kinase [Anaeromyxobacter sp.]
MTGAQTLSGAVLSAVAEVRWRNAVVVGWARLALRGVLIGIYLVAWFSQGEGGIFRTPLLVGGLHFAAGVAALVLLYRRWHVPAVTLVAALVDFAVISWAGWAGSNPADSDALLNAAYMTAAIQTIVAFAAVALPTSQGRWIALLGVAFPMVMGSRAGMEPWLILTLTVVTAAFAFVVLWTGLRMVRMAASMAWETTSGQTLRQHAAELEKMNAEVAAQRDQLVRAQGEAEVLTQLIVHDLKNPLASMLQYLAIAEAELQAMPGTEPQIQHIQHAGDEGVRLAKLIGDLLLLHRLERGAVQPKREPVPMQLLLNGVARSFASRAVDRGVKISIGGDEDLVVQLDLDLVQRLLENLVANALRHVRRGDLISLEAVAEGEQIRLSVRNSGPPVPENIRPRLFERYATEGVREWHNAGLGLYLCRLVAEAHGGSIALVDRPEWPVSFEAIVPAPGALEAKTAA